MTKTPRNGLLFLILCAMLFFAGGCAGPALPQPIENQIQAVQDDSQPVPKKYSTVESLGRDILTLPETIIYESKDIIGDKNNAIALLLAGGASIAMHNTGADGKIADNFRDNQILGRDIDKLVDLFGGPGFHFAASGVWYIASDAACDNFNKARAWTMIEALSINSTATLALKLLRDNRTPNDKWLGWPSGHTSSSFTVASVLHEYYGPEVGLPAYLGAGFVGYRMMDSGDHWASDVLFGAVLGYVIGHHTAGEHMRLELAGFEVLPYTDLQNNKAVAGLSFVKKF